jgi:hypothetical protein
VPKKSDISLLKCRCCHCCVGVASRNLRSAAAAATRALLHTTREICGGCSLHNTTERTSSSYLDQASLTSLKTANSHLTADHHRTPLHSHSHSTHTHTIPPSRNNTCSIPPLSRHSRRITLPNSTDNPQSDRPCSSCPHPPPPSLLPSLLPSPLHSFTSHITYHNSTHLSPAISHL